MSHVALQRVMVRMLYDPAFVERVYSGANPDASVSMQERDWLVKADRRAWRTDPLRRARSLTALLEEFPASAALAGDVRALDAFFSSEEFHRCIQDGGSLAGSFGAWIENRCERPGVARLESAIARVRRAHPRRVKSELVLAAHIEVLELSIGTLDLQRAIIAELGAAPVKALLGDRRVPFAVPVMSGSAERWLLERDRAEVRIEEAGESLFAVLDAARDGSTRAALAEVARSHGADDDAEALGVVGSLVAEGLLERI